VRQINFREKPEDSFEMNEAMNVLRTNIAYSGEQKKSILVTSCSENDGKSAISLQMALNFAAAGQRVLLIDADLRKSVLNGKFGISATDGQPLVGLADLLAGKVEANDVIYKNTASGICFTPIGHYVLNPTPLFESQTFSLYLDFLKDYFDSIIIDSPPLERVIDAAIIGAVCDGVVIVVSAGKTTYDDLNATKQQLLRVGANILGCVLNRVGNPGNLYSYRKRKSNDYYYGGTKK
jgi:capsular exopolysaccharide family